jgi:hypothetical protein
MDQQEIADLSKYDKGFYRDGGDVAYAAALVMLAEVGRLFEFSSVVDFGCGAAGWLRAAAALISKDGRAARLLGVDGPYAEQFAKCEEAQFHFQNLESRVVLASRFDLAISMEVAEHLPASRAATFVEDIAKAADVVLFSAAVPGQGGDNHINEQWQSYWVRRFAAVGFNCFDILRGRLWNHQAFIGCPFYVGNGFLYVRDGHPLSGELTNSRIVLDELQSGYPVDVVHPGVFDGAHFEKVGPRALVGQLPRATIRAVMRRLRKRS